ncbi:MAG: hypothetical protein ACI8X5_004145 [Planctomycetota bacterium]|jgi:hypothetical protein
MAFLLKVRVGSMLSVLSFRVDLSVDTATGLALACEILGTRRAALNWELLSDFYE